GTDQDGDERIETQRLCLRSYFESGPHDRRPGEVRSTHIGEHLRSHPVSLAGPAIVGMRRRQQPVSAVMAVKRTDEGLNQGRRSAAQRRTVALECDAKMPARSHDTAKSFQEARIHLTIAGTDPFIRSKVSPPAITRASVRRASRTGSGAPPD